MKAALRRAITPEYFSRVDLQYRQNVEPVVSYTPGNSDELCGQMSIQLNDTHVQLTVKAQLKPVQNDELFSEILFMLPNGLKHLTVMMGTLAAQFQVQRREIMDLQSNQLYRLQYVFIFQVVRAGGCLLAALALAFYEMTQRAVVVTSLEDPAQGKGRLFDDPAHITVEHYGELEGRRYDFPNKVEARLMERVRLLVRRDDFVVLQM